MSVPKAQLFFFDIHWNYQGLDYHTLIYNLMEWPGRPLLTQMLTKAQLHQHSRLLSLFNWFRILRQQNINIAQCRRVSSHLEKWLHPDCVHPSCLGPHLCGAYSPF